jgi:uncharacterized Tic20 family protein
MDGERAPVSEDEKLWGALAHLAGFAAVLVPLFGGVLATLAIWLTKGRTSAYVEREAREALNFQISVALAALLAIALMYVVIGVFLLIGLIIMDIGCMTRGALKAREGIRHVYPYSLRLVKARS